MNLAEFEKLQKNGEKLMCEQCRNEQLTNLATKVWSKQHDVTLESAVSSMRTFRKGVTVSAVKLLSNDEIYLLCDWHAPETAVKLTPPASIDAAAGLNLGKISSLLNKPFGIRLQSTGSKANVALTRIIFQTYFVSADKPCLLTFDQFILAPFTGPGNFELTESDTNGANEVTIATNSGFANGVTASGHSQLKKVITSDKIYRVVFVPGTAGDGIYSITARELNTPTKR